MNLREYNFHVFSETSQTGFNISCTVHTAQQEVIAQVIQLTNLWDIYENDISITEEDKKNILLVLEKLSTENPELLKMVQGDFGVFIESNQQKYLH